MTDAVTRLNAALEGRYRIERELGEGGMATVYLADDLRHERKVALKVLKPELAAVVGAERFLAEIKTTANLQHSHILPLFDSGEADSFLFYVMPYVEGESLREKLDREHQLPVDEAVRIAMDVADALDHAHRQGVVHRDIKPANVLLREGRPLIADFGIALAARTASGERLTETGLSVGTPYYMSPEQASGDQSVGPATDIYALGCVLYEMLVGEPPYTGSSAQAVLAKILTGEPEVVSDKRRTVPPNVDGAIAKAVERLPADRFASARELGQALGDPAFRYSGSSGARSVAATGWGASSTRWRAVALVATAVAAGAIVESFAGGPGPADTAVSSRGPIRSTLVDSRESGPRPLVAPLAISRDGRDVVFSGVEEGRVRIYRRSLESPEVQPVSGGVDLAPQNSVTFSPDGRSVAFSAPDGLVRRVSVEGGTPVPVANTVTVPIGLSWSEGHGVVMGMFSFSDLQVALSRAATSDTTLHTVVAQRPDSFFMHHDPYVLEGGEFALYIDYDAERRVRLGAVSLATGATVLHELEGSSLDGVEAIVGVADGVLVYRDRTQTLMAVQWDDEERRPAGLPVALPEVPAGAAYAAMSTDGTLAMVVGSQEEAVVVANDRGDVLLSLSDAQLSAAVPRFSPDGSRIAVAAQLESSVGDGFVDPRRLWTYELATGPLSLLPVDVTPMMVTWTPDGRRALVALGFDRADRHTQIWTRAADASDEPSVMLEAPASIWGVEPHPGGGEVALLVSSSTDPMTPAYDIMVRPLEGDTTLVPFAAGDADEVAPRFSPDGRWLAYASNESGRYEVYVRPFPGPGARVQVSDVGGGQPVWSPDGRRLYYRSDLALMAAGLEENEAAGRLAVTSRERLFEGGLRGGPDTFVATYDVHPDGERFVLARDTGATTEIVIWVDWLDELKEILEESEERR